MIAPVPLPEADASDGVLLRRIGDGDEGALATLYDRYGPPAFALARRITGEPGVAQDVVHEAFMAVWREPARYADGDLQVSLVTTTHRLAVRTVRRNETAGRGRDASAADPPEARDGDPGPRGHRVDQALGALPPQQRQALVLAYYSGYTQREIAEQTDTALGTVQAGMVVGMHQLRTLLQGFSDAEGSRL
jgi:RNA polymerase sigma-70 factor, ECF subfamily